MSKPYVALTHDEARRLLAACVAAGDARCHLLFLIALRHGLRVTEALTLTRANFMVDGGRLYIAVARLKGSDETKQIVGTSEDPLFDLLSLVTRHLAAIPGENLFDLTRQGADYLMKRYGQRAGVPGHKLSMHKLKHSCGNWLRHSGADIMVIKSALGHRDIRSTMQYLRTSSDEVEQALDKAFAAAGK